MYLAAIATIILLMKIFDIGPPGSWSWFYVLMPFVVLFIWWEFVSKWIGWDKKAAEAKMKADERSLKEAQKKQRGF